MGVVTDKSLQGLTTAVQGISTSGMTDTTGQAIASAITALAGSIDGKYYTEEKNLGSMNISQGSRGVFLSDISKAGFTPIGIVQVRLSNNWHVLSSFIIIGNNAQVVMQNINSNSLDQTVYVTVLYLKI